MIEKNKFTIKSWTRVNICLRFSLTLSIDLSFIGESKIDPKDVLLSLRLDLDVGDKTSSAGMSVVDLFRLGSTHWLIGMPKTAPSPVLFLFSERKISYNHNKTL